ncbi:hypothetical protein NDU88_002886 [Pleurodeles waltl]|uniref:Uncharacterized protein n=1 Tax=Pleurodeles waltl TaxID=8319 RepID=A0AAV7KTD7_PLEWA|nr:hypothetical protein NDU88_002886 [Pleurodeles waltl]
MFRPSHYDNPICHLFWGSTNDIKSLVETLYRREKVHHWRHREELHRHGARAANICDELLFPAPSRTPMTAKTTMCRVKADSPPSMHHQETVEKAGRMRCNNVAGSVLATLLWFCRRPGAVSGRSFAEVNEESAKELW